VTTSDQDDGCFARGELAGQARRLFVDPGVAGIDRLVQRPSQWRNPPRPRAFEQQGRLFGPQAIVHQRVTGVEFQGRQIINRSFNRSAIGERSKGERMWRFPALADGGAVKRR
jgi:hypothetical protein